MSFEPNLQKTFIIFSQADSGQYDGDIAFYLLEHFVFDIFQDYLNV